MFCDACGRLFISGIQIICSLRAKFNNRFILLGFFDSGLESTPGYCAEIEQLAGAGCSIIEQDALTQASLRFPLREATPG